MGMEKLERIMLNFEEGYIDTLLGDLKDALSEWSFNDKNLVTKKNKISILINVYGLSLFLREEFKYKFFLSIEDKVLLSYLATEYPQFVVSRSIDQKSMAEYLKRMEFSDKKPFSFIVKDYFGLHDYKFDARLKETATDLIEKTGSSFYELYDYQYMIKQQAINDLENPDKALYKLLIHMPTGTGKTKTTMHIIAHYINFVSKNKGCIIWVAHTNELLRQAYDTFVNVWAHLGLKPIKVFKSWVSFPKKVSNGIIFMSVSLLQQKREKPIFEELAKNASLIIFDEVHKAGAPETKKCIDKLMHTNNEFNKKFIGLTATPGRTTDLSRENALFANEFDHIIGIDVDLINSISLTPSEVRNYRGSKEPIKYFQENKYLSKINKEMLDFEVPKDVEKVIKKQLKNENPNYSVALINKISLNKTRNMKIVEKLQELNNQNIPTIVFACSLKHAKMLSAFLNLLDIKNSLVYGDMDSYQRIKAINDFKNGNVNIIINYEILTTGFDSTNIQCVFITRPTKSVILYSQMIGRGLRGPKMGGNSECLLIDVKENLISFDANSAFTHFNMYWE